MYIDAVSQGDRAKGLALLHDVGERRVVHALFGYRAFRPVRPGHPGNHNFLSHQQVATAFTQLIADVNVFRGYAVCPGNGEQIVARLHDVYDGVVDSAMLRTLRWLFRTYEQFLPDTQQIA